MKHILFCFLLICTYAGAQDFAPIGARWFYDSSLEGTTPIYGAYRSYEVVKDTLINGRTCRLISQKLHSRNGVVHLTDVYVYQANDTAFYYHAGLQRFSALYIFTAQMGDTLTFDVPNDFPPRNANQNTWQVVVDSIVPMVYAGDTLRQFYTSPVLSNDTSITFYSFHRPYVEKIGGTFLFLHQPYVIFPEWDGPLRCYVDSTFSINLMGISCDTITATNVEEHQLLNTIKYYPNPANEELRLENLGEKGVFFHLRDLQGKSIQSGLIDSGTHNLNLLDIYPGLYILQFQQGNFIRTERLVIIR